MIFVVNNVGDSRIGWNVVTLAHPRARMSNGSQISRVGKQERSHFICQNLCRAERKLTQALAFGMVNRSTKGVSKPQGIAAACSRHPTKPRQRSKQSSRLQRIARQCIFWLTNMPAPLQCFGLTLRTPELGGCDIL